MFLPAEPLKILNYMKTYHILSFLCGAVLMMLGFSALSGSNPSHHVYESRMYYVNPGKMDGLKARFGDHTDAIFKRHNMKSIGYWMPEDAPSSQNLFVYIRPAIQPLIS
jgi:NIPSNAP